MAVKNVVLVHGNFADGSGWQGVYDHLTAGGFRVAVVQNPTRSFGGDVAVTRQVLDSLGGPAVLAGHSHGGAVITEAGNHPNVAALACIAAFAPDAGEPVSSLIASAPPGAPVPPILPPVNGLVPGRHRRPHDPACRTARCPSEPRRPSPRPPAATPCTSRVRLSWPP
jgi:pimeloyl-ACP methyl ester carboxylesterase